MKESRGKEFCIFNANEGRLSSCNIFAVQGSLECVLIALVPAERVLAVLALRSDRPHNSSYPCERSTYLDVTHDN